MRQSEGNEEEIGVLGLAVFVLCPRTSSSADAAGRYRNCAACLAVPGGAAPQDS